MKIRNGLNNRNLNQATYQGDVKGEGIAIAISEGDQADPTIAVSMVQWLITVWVQLPQGQFFLGGFTTNTANVDGSPSRIVGFASCPGAIGWMVEAVNAFPSSNREFDAELYVQAGKCCGGGPSVQGVVRPPQPPGSGDEGGGGGFVPPVPPT